MGAIKRRLLTCALAIVSAVAVLLHSGEENVLVLSQVVLSLQLPFAIVPLIRFTSASHIIGSFASPPWMRHLAGGAELAVGQYWPVCDRPDGCALLAWVAFFPLRFTSVYPSANHMADNE